MMLVRLAIVLALLLPQVVTSACLPAEGQEETCCCAGSCCGAALERACGCGGDQPVPPRAPVPSEGPQLSMTMLAAEAAVVLDTPPAGVPVLEQDAGPRLRTHNETQALLCIWRT